MTKGISRYFLGTGVAAALTIFLATPASAEDINWDSVEGKDITLFYPGQSAWEWVLTKSSHSGALKLREGRTCSDCHEGEEQSMGNLIVSGQKLEPNPIDHKRGFIPVNVKVAHDTDNFYLRLEWSEEGVDGFPQMDPNYETKVTVMFDDGHLAEATRAGCWGSCHMDNTTMPANSGGDLNKYLSKSRSKNTRDGGGENYKSDAEIEALAAEGAFYEYWQARLNHDQAPVAVGGYILKNREENPNAGVSVSSTFNHGNWVVVFKRSLKVDGDYLKDIVAGAIYTFGVAIHESHAAKRFHHVSFENTFVLDEGEADLVAKGQ